MHDDHIQNKLPPRRVHRHLRHEKVACGHDRHRGDDDGTEAELCNQTAADDAGHNKRQHERRQNVAGTGRRRPDNGLREQRIKTGPKFP